ncbi:MAG: ribulose-phosphate 3-epimerase [Anaerolineales bacterium]
MKTNYLISPSILAADFTKLGDQIKQSQDAGANWFHIDIMDGHFVPNISMGPFIVEACSRVTDLPLDVHLMIKEPDRYLQDFANAGASNLTVHIETCPEINKTLQTIHTQGCQAGITLKPGTGVEKVEPFLKDVDLVLVMTVNPGFSGQSFMPEVVPKIGQIRTILDEINPEALIEVDGGISSTTIRQTYDQGARVFVAGSAIFNHPLGIEGGIQSLREMLS